MEKLRMPLRRSKSENSSKWKTGKPNRMSMEDVEDVLSIFRVERA